MSPAATSKPGHRTLPTAPRAQREAPSGGWGGPPLRDLGEGGQDGALGKETAGTPVGLCLGHHCVVTLEDLMLRRVGRAGRGFHGKGEKNPQFVFSEAQLPVGVMRR